MRFHSVLFAEKLNIPFIAIDYTGGGKIKGFLKDQNKLNLMFDRTDLSNKNWRQKLDTILLNKGLRSMNVVHLCSQDYGGAGKAAYRLHKGLQQMGVASTMLVVNKKSGDPSVKALPSENKGRLTQCLNIPFYESPLWPKQILRWENELAKYPNRPAGLEAFTGALSDIQLEQIQEIRDADIINLHWVAGALDYPNAPLSLRGKQIVWTLHDMNPFTGGCHYSGECEKYKDRCGACPQLGSSIEEDLSRQIWAQKNYAYQYFDLNVVTPSKWLAGCVSQSMLLSMKPIKVIPNGFPLNTFKPYEKAVIRETLNIPENAKVILFGADSVFNKRKGFAYLLEALENLQPNKSNVTVILTFGNFPKGVRIKAKHTIYSLGSIADENQLALAYSAADVFVIPSLEDNLPNTAVEAMACGVPVVGFEIGGIPEIIDHKQNGFLARPGDIASLKEGIEWALSLPDGGKAISDLCREKSEIQFAIGVQAKAYKKLYHSLMSKQESESEAVLSKESGLAINFRQNVEVAEMQNKNTRFLRLTADFNSKTGNLEDALEKNIKILRENPQDLEALLALGIISIDLEKFDDAIVFCQKALEIAPKSIDVRDIFLKLGEKVELSGEINKAREIYLCYLVRNPEEDKITQCWEKLKDTEKDKQIVKKINAKKQDYIVSAIVSTYNSEDFIRECLENLESQTISKNLEIVVVDAASLQNEEQIVKEFQKRYSNITYIKTKGRVGIYAAWNIAIKEASGRYCISASTNDILNQEACEILARYLDENQECMLVYGDTYLTKTPHENFRKKSADNIWN
jgi:glycosyltransferase involved in cell wall biosynthesis